ncbi:ead/Ea22-like family protein [Escherichia coli]|uniref:ead/Ea22-like family protein n=1 Tax=Escherichia coli TaxID=562 RepID=UPI00096A4906|nr:ead/Ea22-like family protein [Escherichia coli]EFB1664399.1 ead/Ea22-like family protein [Escherichia coli]EFC4142629.1 ead/Ea22-like family protein [Escherichia coli]EFG7943670.1 ead/Ea22-like family protein [Escherichia coli]EFN4487110.1 ead/Ea22-like family protein [Escherichia coli]EJU9835156.1 ead/Ea22-like family protein [Escherichia coli]
MSEVNYQALREIAKQATQGEWRAFISSDTGTYAVHTPGYDRCDDIIKWPGFDGQKNAENNARYIAAFNPAVVLALLDVLDASLDVKPVASCIVEDGGMCVDGFSEYVGHSLPDGMHELYAAPPASVVPEGLVKAVRFYEQVKCENPPVETGAWKNAVDWVLNEACQAVNIGIKGA